MKVDALTQLFAFRVGMERIWIRELVVTPVYSGPAGTVYRRRATDSLSNSGEGAADFDSAIAPSEEDGNVQDGNALSTDSRLLTPAGHWNTVTTTFQVDVFGRTRAQAIVRLWSQSEFVMRSLLHNNLMTTMALADFSSTSQFSPHGLGR